ncbi:hypothetical protein CDAR_18861 [Caerostris darwini]|uniref:Uncharacterized protein n=1 Tax=Caerostris darwini TaxID=1538125 RepID=A0AAV4WBS3_9ARAC|nr:hypothetical protein CDAR_18861 [Caerostris darwini]
MAQTTSQTRSITLCIIPESNQIPEPTRGFPLTFSKERMPGQLGEVMSLPVLISAIITGSGSLSEFVLAPLTSAKDGAGPNVHCLESIPGGTIRRRPSSNHSPIMAQTTSQTRSITLCIIPESNQIPEPTRGFPLTLSKERVPGQLGEVMSPPVLISAIITGSGSLSESAFGSFDVRQGSNGP